MKLITPLMLIFPIVCSAAEIDDNLSNFMDKTLAVQLHQNQSSVVKLFGKPEDDNIKRDFSPFRKGLKIDYIYEYSSPESINYMSIALYKKKVVAFHMCYEYMAAPGAYADKCMSVKEFWKRYKSDKL